MINVRPFKVWLVGLVLVIGPGHSTFAQDDAAPAPPVEEAKPESQQQFESAMQLYADGDYAEAAALFNGLDAAQLSKDQRVTMEEALATIATETAVATPASTLGEAKTALATGDLASALNLYQSVLENDDASEEEKQAALAGRAGVERKLNADITMARKQISAAESDIRAGRLEDAESKLAGVQTSGLDLGWFDNARVKRNLARIAEVKAESANLALAAAVAQDAAAGEEPTTEPAEEPTTEPVAEPVAEPTTEPAEEPKTNGAEAQENVDTLGRAKTVYAQSMVKQGDEAQQKGQYRLAIKYYTNAIKIDPENAAAVAGLEAAQAKLDAVLAPSDAIDIATGDVAVRMAAITAEYNAKMNKARELLAVGKFTGSVEAVQQAKLILDRNQRVLPQDRYKELRDEAVKLTATIEESQRHADALRMLEIESGRERDAAERTASEAERRETEIHTLLMRARDLRKQQKYQEALNVLDQALFQDPNNPAAALMKETVEDNMIYVEQVRMERIRNRKVAHHAIDIYRAAIPPNELVLYPADWPQLTRRRIEALEAGTGDSEINQRVQNAMQASVPINFEENKLENVMDYLRNTTGQNFYVNWAALQNNAGIERDSPVTLQLKGIPVNKVLDLVLEQVGAAAGDLDPIGWTVDEGIVTISTKSDLKKTVKTKLYDIRDLLIQAPDFSNAPAFDLNSALSNTNSGGSQGGGGGGGGGGSGEGLFGDEGDGEDEVEVTREELVQQITELITENVGDFDEWVQNGGDISSLRELNGQLVVKTTPDNHREILTLLADLRETRAMQVNVEAKFLLVDQNFLEDAGFDMDVTFSDLAHFPLGISVTQDHATMADRPSTALTSSRVKADEDGFIPRGIAVNAFYLLDDLQINVMMHASQFNERVVRLTAPRVTMFNGQRAFVIVASQFSFISDLQPTPDTFGFDPTLSVIQEGTVLDVRATISADRRYVVMTLRPSLAQIVDIRTLAQNADNNVDQGPDANNDNNVDDIIADNDGVLNFDIGLTAFIEAPELELTEIRSTVSVPDKGTLLMGGQRLYAETEITAGVPILSKIPWLNRLFTNQTSIRDERTLLILVKPTIILQGENEERIWPGITKNPTNYPVSGPEPKPLFWKEE